MQAKDRFNPSALRCAGVLLGVLLCGMTGLAQSPPPASAPAGQLFVGDVLVQGNRLVPTAQVMAQIKTRAGAVYDADKVQEDCRILSATRQFANVSVDVKPAADGKITVIFTVKDQANLRPAYRLQRGQAPGPGNDRRHRTRSLASALACRSIP